MQDTWWKNKAKELQEYADTHDMKNFYASLRSVYGPASNGSTPMLSADGGTLLTERDQILKRWVEHFDGVLNRRSHITQEVIDNIQQQPMKEEMSAPPTANETKKAIKQITSGKAPGADGIPAEVFKAGDQAMIDHLTSLFGIMWESGKLPQEFRDATIVHLYKRKGARSVCDNHRGISLLSIAGKILARILLNRLILHISESFVPESQCGFRKGRGTADMIFTIRQLQEKCLEQHMGLYIAFIDLTKAFDTVSREGLWKILPRLGCPPKFLDMLKQFHTGMMARVADNGSMSDPFPVSNGVKQGCVLAPTLFSILFAAMLHEASTGLDRGVHIQFRTDGRLFNIRRLKSQTKLSNILVREMLFADDCALVAHTEEDLQVIMDRFATACSSYGLTISLKKTEVMLQPPPGHNYIPPSITISGTKLNAVDQFTYLGSTLSRSANIDAEVSRRISKASGAFGGLRQKLWHKRGIKLETKLSVYKATVLTSLLYACETWTTYARHIKQLDRFHQRCLREIMRIKWYDKVPDTDVLKRANMTGIEAMVGKSRLRWAGDVVRMDDTRLPKAVLYAQLKLGNRSRGGQHKRFKDTLKDSIKKCGIPCDSWETLAQDRPLWRKYCHTGIAHFENERILRAMEKRQLRKSQPDQPPTGSSLLCPECGRSCKSKSGLLSHLRAHSRKSNPTQ